MYWCQEDFLLHINHALPAGLCYIPLGSTSGILFHERNLACLGNRIFFPLLLKEKKQKRKRSNDSLATAAAAR